MRRRPVKISLEWMGGEVRVAVNVIIEVHVIVEVLISTIGVILVGHLLHLEYVLNCIVIS